MRSAAPASDFGLTASAFTGASAPPKSTPITITAPRRPAAEAFHGILGEVVLANDPYTESDPAAVLLQLYVLVGSVIGRSPHCYADSVRHGLNENVLIVGPTGDGRKGTSYSNARQFVIPADAEWASDRIQGGLSSGEGLVHAVRDPNGEDLGVPDKRLLVVETEFGGVLKVMSRKGCTVSELIRQGFDSHGLHLLTRNRPASCAAPHISIVAHTTEADLERHLDDADVGNGFLNRFIIAYSRRSKLLPQSPEMPRDRFFKLTAAISGAVAFARGVELMPRDEEARKLWDAHYTELSSSHSGVYGALVSRGAAHVTRLSMICALMDRSYFVRGEHLQAALAIWRYSQDSVRFVFGDAVGDRIADAILVALRRDGTLTRTQMINVLGRNTPASEIERALATLQSLHMVIGDGKLWMAIDPQGAR